MYARLTIIQINASDIDEVRNIFEESIFPMARQSWTGFAGGYLLVDPDHGNGMAMTLWNSKQDALDNEMSGAYQEAIQRFGTWFTMPPVREGYDVLIRPESL